MEREDQDFIRPRSGKRLLSIAISTRRSLRHRNWLGSRPICTKLPLFNLDTVLVFHRPRTLTLTPDTYHPKALRDVSSLVTLSNCSRAREASGSLRIRTWNQCASLRTSVLVGKALVIVHFPHGPCSPHVPDVIPSRYPSSNSLFSFYSTTRLDSSCGRASLQLQPSKSIHSSSCTLKRGQHWTQEHVPTSMPRLPTKPYPQ